MIVNEFKLHFNTVLYKLAGPNQSTLSTVTVVFPVHFNLFI